MEEQILKIKELALADIEKAQNSKELEEVKNKLTDLGPSLRQED